MKNPVELTCVPSSLPNGEDGVWAEGITRCGARSLHGFGTSSQDTAEMLWEYTCVAEYSRSTTGRTESMSRRGMPREVTMCRHITAEAGMPLCFQNGKSVAGTAYGCGLRQGITHGTRPRSGSAPRLRYNTGSGC